jgi:hypothetical protein
MLASFADDSAPARLCFAGGFAGLERGVGLDKSTAMSLNCCAGFRSWHL